MLEHETQKDDADQRARSKIEETACIRRMLHAFESKRQTTAAARIQACFRGWKVRVLSESRLLAVENLKMAKATEHEMRKGQIRLREQHK